MDESAGSSLGQVMASNLLVTKHLGEPVKIIVNWITRREFEVKFEAKYKGFCQETESKMPNAKCDPLVPGLLRIIT